MERFVAIYLGSATALAQWKATDDRKRKEQETAGMDAHRALLTRLVRVYCTGEQPANSIMVLGETFR